MYLWRKIICRATKITYSYECEFNYDNCLISFRSTVHQMALSICHEDWKVLQHSRVNYLSLFQTNFHYFIQFIFLYFIVIIQVPFNTDTVTIGTGTRLQYEKTRFLETVSNRACLKMLHNAHDHRLTRGLPTLKSITATLHSRSMD